MSDRGIDVIMASADGEEVKDIVQAEGVVHVSFPLSRSISPFLDIYAIIKLTLWLRKGKFDIVHSHTPKAGFVGMIASYLARIPIRMHTIAGIPWIQSSGIKRSILRSVDRLIYLCATNVYSNSRELLKFIERERLVHIRKLNILGLGSSNGIDMEYFSPESVNLSKGELREDLGIKSDSFVYLFVGRVVRDKGMNELFRAFSQMSTGCNLVIVGPLESSLDPFDSQALEFFQNSENVHMMGYQNDVRPFFKLSDVLVFPSHREGFPNVPLQALAMELPSIVTDINGCNEIVQQELNGLLIKPKCSESLLNAMNRVREDQKLYERLKYNSRKSMMNRYDQKYVHELIFNEYQRLYESV
ncbi:glycosyltransferase family 4 protein [Roseivirga sp.]|uniref:glycosyltransferase family 4 protein n=1 Tax=Roseivirga sp. TaxID=1964215 RepID=UPI003B52F06E